MQQRMYALPEITKNLIIINVLMFLASMTFKWFAEYFSLYSMYSPYFQPVQIVTHMFMHGGISHVFFNMFALFMFGSEIERAFGAKKFLMYYLLTGFGAALLQSGVNYMEIQQAMQGLSIVDVNKAIQEGGQLLYERGQNYSDPQLGGLNMLLHTRMLGASGAVFGLLAAFGMLYPNRVIYMLIPPIPLKAKYFVLIYGAIELDLGVSKAQTGVAHFAHLGGALFGVLLIIIWRKQGARF